MAFVHLVAEGEEDEGEFGSTFVFLHLFCAPTDRKRPPHARREGEGDMVFDINDDLCLCGVSPSVTLPRVIAAFSPNGKPFFSLVDTQAIESGLWCQEDFDLPGYYWLIHHRYD